MLDQELRARAAGIVRAHASMLSCSPGSEPGVHAETRALADALEAEPAREVELAEALRERDEAREVLREVLDAYGAVLPQRRTDAVKAAAGLLEGVERTHAVVPVAPLERAAVACDEIGVLTDDHENSSWAPLAQALRATARGERAEWPAA